MSRYLLVEGKRFVCRTSGTKPSCAAGPGDEIPLDAEIPIKVLAEVAPVTGGDLYD
jgi:hypothetical protein